MKMTTILQTGRRAFLLNGALLLGSAAAGFRPTIFEPEISFGLITDLHYADKNPAGSRHYRETLQKIETAAEQFTKSKISFVVELGDFIDAASSVQTEISYLKKINRKYETISSDRHYVLGNHCVDTLTKKEFLGEVGKSQSYYSFDRGGYHFVVLDACFRKDGTPYSRRNFKWTDPNVPAKELDWLKQDLGATSKKVIVFAHQRLDVANHYGIKNNVAIREMLEKKGNVAAVFQGHSHKNDLKQINGIPYCTMVAMVEGSGKSNNGYSVVKLSKDGSVLIDGFIKQKDYSLKK